MTVDRLEALLQRHQASARMFHSGPLCGIHDFEPQGGSGQLHLLRRGPLEVRHQRGAALQVDAPSLLFYPRPFWHRFNADAELGADLVCAQVSIGDAEATPLTRSLPDVLCLPLAELSGMEGLLELLFEEAFAQRCGRQAVVDRLFEVVLIRLLRHLLDSRQLETGLLAGLADPRLARLLVALHRSPAEPWSLPGMAAAAGMSRSLFAREFHRVLGQTPADYLAQWRLGIAAQRIRRGDPLKQIAADVGYARESALSRAFKARYGVSPRQWRA